MQEVPQDGAVLQMQFGVTSDLTLVYIACAFSWLVNEGSVQGNEN